MLAAVEMATPMLALTTNAVPSGPGHGRARASRTDSATTTALTRSLTPFMSTTNSSPPQRATTSRGRTAPVSRRATSASRLSPT